MFTKVVQNSAHIHCDHNKIHSVSAYKLSQEPVEIIYFFE